MWADTKQLLILKRLTASLETVSGIDVQVVSSGQDGPKGVGVVDSNGKPVLQQVTLAGRVYRGRNLFGNEQDGPFLAILEGTKPEDVPTPVGEAKTLRSENWYLLVQGFMEDDPKNPLDNLYRLKGSVEQQLSRMVQMTDHGDPKYPDDYMMGGLITDLLIGPGVVFPTNPQQGGTEAFYLPIVVTFVMNVADPYSP